MEPTKVNLWVTPKIFPDPRNPDPEVDAFFDHYADLLAGSTRLVLNFATGNGDHILNFRGLDHLDDTFDWARYNCFAGDQRVAHEHNREWIRRVREGGELSDNPYMAGPMVIISDETLDYATLQTIYRSFRRAARDRGIALTLLEYLEPGPEFCVSTWKTVRHPEVASHVADAGGNLTPGLMDVCAVLDEDHEAYAAFPTGIPADTVAGDFVAAQSAAFVEAMELDGVLLGNQFGLLGLWDPSAAPPPTDERRAGITSFFQAMRASFGSRLVYWQDTFWPPAIEDAAWGMDAANYGLLDGIICSNFGVLVERMNIEVNVTETARILAAVARPVDLFFSFDFVDPWYWYRTYLDDRRIVTFQRDVYNRVADLTTGIMFFANDTFGQFVPRGPLDETLAAIGR
jgi:hypothetical protein